jgi:hypothetical protein
VLGLVIDACGESILNTCLEKTKEKLEEQNEAFNYYGPKTELIQ